MGLVRQDCCKPSRHGKRAHARVIRKDTSRNDITDTEPTAAQHARREACVAGQCGGSGAAGQNTALHFRDAKGRGPDAHGPDAVGKACVHLTHCCRPRHPAPANRCRGRRGCKAVSGSATGAVVWRVRARQSAMRPCSLTCITAWCARGSLSRAKTVPTVLVGCPDAQHLGSG